MSSETGKWIIGVGAIVIIIGIIVYFFHDKLNWIGRLPGDIRVEKENFKFYAPLASMLLVSVAITILVWLFRKISGH